MLIELLEWGLKATLFVLWMCTYTSVPVYLHPLHCASDGLAQMLIKHCIGHFGGLAKIFIKHWKHWWPNIRWYTTADLKKHWNKTKTPTWPNWNVVSGLVCWTRGVLQFQAWMVGVMMIVMKVVMTMRRSYLLFGQGEGIAIFWRQRARL